MGYTARYLPLHREKARERSHPAHKGDQGGGGDRLHSEVKGHPRSLLGYEERVPGIELDGVVHQRQIHSRPIRFDQGAELRMATEETGITKMALTARRPDGPKRLSRTPTHEERPAGPRARLSREADAHLRHRVHWPSERGWPAHDSHDESREQCCAQHHAQCNHCSSPIHPHSPSPRSPYEIGGPGGQSVTHYTIAARLLARRAQSLRAPASTTRSEYCFAAHTPAVSLHGRVVRSQAGGPGYLEKKGRGRGSAALVSS